MPRTDESIKKDVTDELCWNHSVDASHVKIEVVKGAVILTGTVPSFRARLEAGVSAASIPGVKTVANRLEVDVKGATPVPSDDAIQQNAAKALSFSPDLGDANLSILVKQGHLIVKGTVDALWKKVLADSLLGNIAGVRSIENLLAVVPNDSPGDIGTAKDIVDALKRRLGSASEKVTVKVKDGKALLMGTVPDAQAAERAQKAALFTFGVTHVTTQLNIRHGDEEEEHVTLEKGRST